MKLFIKLIQHFIIWKYLLLFEDAEKYVEPYYAWAYSTRIVYCLMCVSPQISLKLNLSLKIIILKNPLVLNLIIVLLITSIIITYYCSFSANVHVSPLLKLYCTCVLSLNHVITHITGTTFFIPHLCTLNILSICCVCC